MRHIRRAYLTPTVSLLLHSTIAPPWKNSRNLQAKIICNGEIIQLLVALNRSNRPSAKTCIVSLERRGTPPAENNYGVTIADNDQVINRTKILKELPAHVLLLPYYLSKNSVGPVHADKPAEHFAGTVFFT